MTARDEREFSRILFTGDTSLNADYWSEPACSPQLIEYLENADLAVTNLEGACRTQDPVDNFGPNISVSRSTIESIRDFGFDAVSLSNNHIRDFGSSGVKRTIRECRKAGLQAFGAGESRSDAFEPLEATVTGQDIGIIGISEHEGSIVGENRSGAAWAYDAELVKRLNERSSEYDLTFLVAHGGLEYIPIPPASWRSHLRTLAETGIDAIIAHHPHTPQGWECYEGTPIFYSLGNFLMYDPKYPSTRWSIGVDITLSGSEVDSISPVLFSAVNGAIEIVDKKGNNSEYNRYLDHTSAIIQNDSTYSEYWNEIAVRLYSDTGYRYQYYDRLKDFGSGHLSSIISNPILELDRLLRGVWGDTAQREKELAVLDQLQCRSHCDAIQTAIESEMRGNISGKDIQNEIDNLFEISDGTHDRSLPERQWNRLSTVFKRLIID